MKFLLIFPVLLFSLAFGCATLNRFEPLCQVVASDKICEALDIIGDVIEDIDAVTGEEETE